MTLRIGSLCSGYGGLDLGIEYATGQPITDTLAWHAEKDPAAARVLEHHLPSVPNIGDLTTARWGDLEPVDVLTAGYPCQPFSLAGARKGSNDERHLWPYIAEAVRRIRPGYVLLENVAGHRSMGFGRVLADLAALGYVGSWRSVRASDVGAPHRRDRVFILARRHDHAPGDTLRVAGPETVERGRLVGAVAGPGAERRAVGSDRAPTADADGAAVRLESVPVPGRGGPPVAAHDGGAGAPADADDCGGDRGERAARRDPVHGAAPAGVREGGSGRQVEWGNYQPAIDLWTRTLGRGHPAPAFLGPKGWSLAAPFVEWVMGLPAGWVTDVPDLSNRECLHILGNGVVPAQAAAALRMLIPAA